MILLTLPAVAGSLPEEIIAVDPWSVVTVRKSTYVTGYKETKEGSAVHISEGIGVIQVTEPLVDVVRMVEFAIKEHENGD